MIGRSKMLYVHNDIIFTVSLTQQYHVDVCRPSRALVVELQSSLVSSFTLPSRCSLDKATVSWELMKASYNTCFLCLQAGKYMNGKCE